MESKNMLSKYQKYFIGIAIVLSSIAISIRSSEGKVSLILGEYPFVIFLLVVFSSFLVIVYFQINRRKISRLSNQIREQSKIKSEEADALLNELTERQKEVYDLIILGRTNKEIMTELFIEQSTLKSHINQIYRKTNIKSRGELKSKVKR
ncbi:response regulator transcription factor [Croceitalea marina]|uniref:Response regulator transcription factor n=1 Tax=Croceitalea marina TaxID=1775166 RepID=A0ABW5MSB3_9FLAO